MRLGIGYLLGLGISTTLALASCGPESEDLAQVFTVQQVREPEPRFRNCRAILSAREVADHDTGIVSLTFTIIENPNYNPALGDACKGNLVNLWQDLELFEFLIKKHENRISHFTFLTPKLEYFPNTYRELVLYIDDAAKAQRHLINPDQYKRTVLVDVLTLRRAYIELIRDETSNYFTAVHAPIINNYLRTHNLQMAEYGANEKISFCIVAWNNCIEYFLVNKEIAETLHRDLDILYAGSWDFWRLEPLQK